MSSSPPTDDRLAPPDAVVRPVDGAPPTAGTTPEPAAATKGQPPRTGRRARRWMLPRRARRWMLPRRARRPRSLRTRLLIAVIALLSAVLVSTGVVATFAIRGSLIGQLDRQLTASQGRVGLGRAAPPPPGPARRLPTPAEWRDVGPIVNGQPPGTLGAVVVGGRVTISGIRDPASTTAILAVPDAADAAIAGVPVDGRAYTRDLGDAGRYRLAARVDGDATVVLGLPLAPVDRTVRDLVIVESALAAGALLLAGAAGALIIRRSLRPLERVAATAARVTELPLDRGEVALPVRVPDADTDPDTEVGRVGAALNRMLTHVSDALAARHASETRVRQFVADASHELRTPLAAIRGYAELARRGREPVPADVAHALRRVESEGARMTALVDDLLLLARLDAGRPLAAEAVDLTALVVDAVGDAHAAGPDHTWRLDLPDGAVLVRGDPARLHQVVANLLANARAHTPPGTTAVTALTVDGDRAVLTVTDDGPGIPAGPRDEIFERFTRGDSSRSRAAGSTGLGLAIVAAVVDAHRGDVTVASEPGTTTFTVRLPRFTADT